MAMEEFAQALGHGLHRHASLQDHRGVRVAAAVERRRGMPAAIGAAEGVSASSVTNCAQAPGGQG